MEANTRGTGRLPAAFLTPGSSSFLDFLEAHRPELIPGRQRLPEGVMEAPHGTTIVAAIFDGGVVIAGDRRATMGNVIAQRDMEKVFPADEYSAVGVAGTMRPRDRDGPDVPAGAGALREDRGRRPLPGGQGQPADHHDPGQPGHGDAGPRGRPDVRGLRHRPGPRPDLHLRRHRRPFRGARLRRHRIRLGLRPRLDEEAPPRGPDGPAGVHHGRPGPLRRGRRRLRDRRPRPRPQDLPDRLADHRGRLPPASPTRRSARSPSPSPTSA